MAHDILWREILQSVAKDSSVRGASLSNKIDELDTLDPHEEYVCCQGLQHMLCS